MPKSNKNLFRYSSSLIEELMNNLEIVYKNK